MTKPDRTRHPQKADALTAPQTVAAELVAQGQNDTKVGEAVGVSRQTVNGWRHDNPAFIAAVNLHRREMYAEAREQLRALSLEAVGVLGDAMRYTQPIKALPAALAVLKAVAAMPPPAAPTTPEGVRRQVAEAMVNDEDAATPMSPTDTLLAEVTEERPRRVAAMMERLREG